MTEPLRVALATPVTTLVLIGGGEFSFGETREVDEYLVSRMAPGRKTIAFLPTGSGSAEYAGHFGRYIQTIDSSLSVVNVPIYRGRDSRRPKNLAALTAAGMIYLGGGVTNSLLSTLRESPAEEAMREAAANGTVIAAIGAAASSFGRHARDMSGATHSLPGFGWLPNAAIETGFDSAEDGALRRLMSLEEIAIGLGIPTGTAVAIDSDGVTRVLGSGQLAVYRRP